MTYENYISYIEHPESIQEEQVAELKELVEKYPYFGVAHWLYLKALKNSNNIFFASELSKTSLFCQDKKNLYFYIHPEEVKTIHSRGKSGRDGSYFDMIENFDNKDEQGRQSLKSLAARLKAARESYNADVKISKESIEGANNHKETEGEFIHKSFDSLEEMAKKYVVSKNYAQALKILNYLNLNNPKKSIYFADQINFLEKVLQKDIK